MTIVMNAGIDSAKSSRSISLIGDSISDGILCGVISYVAINVICGNFKKLNITLYILAVLFVMKYIFI